MQVGCYEIEIYQTYSNKETVDFLLNNVIKLICVQFVNIFSSFDLHFQLLCEREMYFNCIIKLLTY